MDYPSTKRCFFNFSDVNNQFDLKQTNLYITKKKKLIS